VYLLYIDDSGSVTDKKCNHCVLAGFAVYETKPYWIERALNTITNKHLPSYPEVELHGSPMHSGHKEWRGIPQVIREDIIMEVLQLIASDRSIRLFASVISKSATPNFS
jgi:hypothetical protein